MMDDRDCWKEGASEHYRELVTRLREMAGKCCLPIPQRELLILARRYERRADHLDRKAQRETRLYLVRELVAR